MKIMKRIIALLLIFSMCFSMAGCEEALEEVVQNAAEDYISEKKEQTEDALNDAVGSVVGELEGGINSAVGEMEGSLETYQVTNDLWVGADTVYCDHTIPVIYIEESTADISETTETLAEEIIVLPTESSTDEKKIFDITIRITCKCGYKNIEGLDYETFKSFVDPEYSGWDRLLNGVSEYEYYSRKYAIYLGVDPIDLNIGSDAEECVIHFDANGGFSPPEDQYFNPNAWIVPTISEDTPVRPGYHFVGWTRIEGDDEPLYFAGEKMDSETGQIFEQDTILYACWSKHTGPASTPLGHKYEVVQKRTAVSIKCKTCGMAVNNRQIDITEFLYYCFNEETKYAHLGNKKEKYYNMYLCYKAQDVGPVALFLNTSFFDETSDPVDRFDELIGNVNDISGTIGEASEDAGKLANRLLTTKADKEFAEDFFEGITNNAEQVSDAAEKASLAISIYQTAKAFKKMTNPDASTLDATMSFLDTLECVASFTSVDSCVKPIFNVLKEGLKLVEKCQAYEKNYLTALDETLDEVNGKPKPYLDDIFNGKDLYLMLGELATGSEIGCSCGNSPSSCDFVKGQYLKSGPSVFDVICRMQSTPEIPTAYEKELLLCYLAERSQHELYVLTGLTLDEYAALADNEFN